VNASFLRSKTNNVSIGLLSKFKPISDLLGLFRLGKHLSVLVMHKTRDIIACLMVLLIAQHSLGQLPL
jgi:hypothetical protein